MTGLPKGDGIPRPKTGRHTASIVAHDGQTEQLGSLLAMTVGKEVSLVIEARCKH